MAPNCHVAGTQGTVSRSALETQKPVGKEGKKIKKTKIRKKKKKKLARKEGKKRATVISLRSVFL